MKKDQQWRRKQWISGWLVSLLAMGASAQTGHHANASKTAGRWGGDQPVPVQVATVQRGDVDITTTALGTVMASNTAVVKVRVAGQLTRIAFQEGQTVQQGALLAEIDPRPFQAKLDQAEGQLQRDQALLANAKADLARYRGLLKEDSIASQEVDAQAALVRQYEGTVKNDQGGVDDARLQLDFTRITAPFAGRLGLRQVDVGNYVQTSDTNGIVVMTQTQPIQVLFAVPADQLPAVLVGLNSDRSLTVDALDRSATTVLATGKLVSADNQIDAATNTVKLKAEFENKDDALFPNQFVNARLHLDTRRDAVLLPSAGIQRGAEGSFVYAVTTDNTVDVRAVKLGMSSGDNTVVNEGLAGGERVVIDGADKLRSGSQVVVAEPGAGSASAESATPTPRAP